MKVCIRTPIILKKIILELNPTKYEVILMIISKLFENYFEIHD